MPSDYMVLSHGRIIFLYIADSLPFHFCTILFKEIQQYSPSVVYHRKNFSSDYDVAISPPKRVVSGIRVYYRRYLKMTESNEKIRLDKWLWAARFFKTRSLASQAVNGGRVHLNGSRIKASRAVNIGDTLLINKSGMEFEIIVLALNDKRRPAVEARQLYEESSESIAKRSEQAEQRKLIRAGQPAPAKRPDKRDRRKIREFTRKR